MRYEWSGVVFRPWRSCVARKAGSRTTETCAPMPHSSEEGEMSAVCRTNVPSSSPSSFETATLMVDVAARADVMCSLSWMLRISPRKMPFHRVMPARMVWSSRSIPSAAWDVRRPSFSLVACHRGLQIDICFTWNKGGMGFHHAKRPRWFSAEKN